MAMFERRSSMESFERWREHSPSGSERQRKLSFNPVGEWSPSPAAPQHRARVPEVSAARRMAQVCVAVTYCLLAAGVVFGFAALKPVLVDQGVYRDRCTKQEVRDGVWVCYGQELRLNLMFTVAAVSTNVCALPVGTVLDRFGPRVSGFVGVVFLTLGALALAFASDLPFDAYIPGYLCLALGGPFIFISSFQLSNTFPKHSGLILALLTGAFDTSSAVFLVYRLIYQATDASFTPKKFFLIYLFVPAFVLIAQLVLMPSASYKTAGELAQEQPPPSASQPARPDAIQEDSEITALLPSKSDSPSPAPSPPPDDTGVWGALHGVSAGRQIPTPWFILITLFTVTQMLRINYFVATVRTQYSYLLSSRALAEQINNFFDLALPLGGLVSIPFVGLVLDHTSTTFVLALLVAIASLIGLLGLIPANLPAAYANVVLFVLYRPLYYTAVSDYAAKVFGFATFGKVYGLIICLAGLGNFAQAALDAVTHDPALAADDPTPVNAALLVAAAVVGVALVAFVWRKTSSGTAREALEEEAQAAPEVEVPHSEG